MAEIRIVGSNEMTLALRLDLSSGLYIRDEEGRPCSKRITGASLAVTMQLG